MTVPILVPVSLLSSSLATLRAAGREGRECVVLWLGKRTPEAVHVTDVYVPGQVAAADFFRIPRESIEALFAVLRDKGLMIAAQVHTHPEQAFHSVADDTWAIVRHVGALSLVLPHFASRTSEQTFFDDAATFCLSQANEWQEVPHLVLDRYVRAVP